MNRTDQNSPDGREKPENWDYYAGMLREYGAGMEPPDRLREAGSNELWESALRQRQRDKTRRWLLYFPSATLLFLMVVVVVDRSISGEEHTLTDQVYEVAEPLQMSQQSDMFEAPEAPPIWIDSDLEAIELPGFPGVDMDMADSTFTIPALIDTPVAGE